MLHSLDRQKIILDNLKNGSVTSINHLIKSTNFNQSTIRRDIKVLERHKKVIVVRGGIIPGKNIEINPIKIENSTIFFASPMIVLIIFFKFFSLLFLYPSIIRVVYVK